MGAPSFSERGGGGRIGQGGAPFDSRKYAVRFWLICGGGGGGEPFSPGGGEPFSP